MLASGAITYGIYKLLQAYYSGVRLEDPLAEYRHFMRSIGDIYFFCSYLSRSPFYFSSGLPSPT